MTNGLSDMASLNLQLKYTCITWGGSPSPLPSPQLIRTAKVWTFPWTIVARSPGPTSFSTRVKRTSQQGSEVQSPERETEYFLYAFLPTCLTCAWVFRIQNSFLCPYPWTLNANSRARHFSLSEKYPTPPPHPHPPHPSRCRAYWQKQVTLVRITVFEFIFAEAAKPLQTQHWPWFITPSCSKLLTCCPLLSANLFSDN